MLQDFLKHNKIHQIMGGIATLAFIFIVYLFINNKFLNDKITLQGNVDIRQVELGFRVNGRIAEMHVDEGDTVKEGDVLAVLDKSSFLHARDIAKGQVDQSAAALKKMEAGNRVQEIEQARAAVKEQEAAYEYTDKFLKRQANLLKTRAVSQQAYDDALAHKQEAEAKLKSAQEALKLSEEGFRAEDIEAARADLAIANARLANAETDLKDTEIRAPKSGKILTRAREPGAIVGNGGTVYTLSLQNPVWVRVYVSEIELGRVKPGMEAMVYTDTNPDKPFKGQIGFISPKAEFTPKNIETKELRTNLVYRLRIIVEDTKGELRQGMPVTVSLKASN
ncbi:MAG: secretion protein HlyD [Alphaproteobacteria bacterium]|nr:secretion protein HlyD [Alphaproteobacteria bacterium]